MTGTSTQLVVFMGAEKLGSSVLGVNGDLPVDAQREGRILGGQNYPGRA
jgi:hypothetical protein